MSTFAEPILHVNEVIEERGYVRLHRKKFAELLGYIEHLEHSFKFADFDHERELNFSRLLLCVLDNIFEAVVAYGQVAVKHEDYRLYETYRSLNHDLEGHLERLHSAYSEGALSDDHRRELHSRLEEVLSKVGTAREESGSAGGAGGAGY